MSEEREICQVMCPKCTDIFDNECLLVPDLRSQLHYEREKRKAAEEATAHYRNFVSNLESLLFTLKAGLRVKE